MSDQEVLYSALRSKTGAELISEKLSDRQLRASLRVAKGQPTTMWLDVIDHLIALGDQQVASGKPEWTIDISKHYFRKPGLRFTWRVIVQGENLPSVYSLLAEAIANVQPSASTSEITEVRLHGSPSRKSGGLTGQIATGPAALRKV